MKPRYLFPVCALLLLAGVAGSALARADGYDLSWWTVEAGGETFLTGEGYTLSGTSGQAEVGMVDGGGYALAGGFWTGPGRLWPCYLPVTVRSVGSVR